MNRVIPLGVVAALSAALAAHAFAADAKAPTNTQSIIAEQGLDEDCPARPNPTADAWGSLLEVAYNGLPSGAPQATTLQLVHQGSIPSVDAYGVHYRPRERGSWGRHVDSQGVSQIHLGFYDPNGDIGSRFLVGIRGGPMLDDHVQIGVGVDWAHKTENQSTVTSTQTGPGGVPIERRTDLSRASTNFFPILAHLQISGGDDLPIIPYFGIGGGYEVLVLSGDDFQTGQSFDGTFGGWGWQMWGGAGFPLGGRTRLNGELYWNGAELGRDVTDDVSGITYRETVNGDGMGARVGLAWGF